MDNLIVSLLVSFLLLTSLKESEGSTEVADAEIEIGEISSGHFAISQKVIEDEIHRRTTQGNVCDGDIRDILLKDETEWSISINLANVRQVQGDPNIEPHHSLVMKIYGEQVSLGLAYFTTEPSQENSHVFVVDSFTWSDGVVTVKRGDDYLVLNFELGDDCLTDLKGAQAKNVTLSILESWYPYSTHLSDCSILGWPETVCNHLTENMCELQKVDNDICLKDTYEGYVCGLSMKIMSMTGIFREKSLLTAKIPMKSVEGLHFNGLRRIGIVYPCLFNDGN